MKINHQKLKNALSRFRKKKVLVVGDLILDHHIIGSVDRISPEAPVPVVWARKEQFACGGAANVGLNLHSLGANVSLCGVVGNDHFGSKLSCLAAKDSIEKNLIVKDAARPTTIKTRIMASNQQVVRLDWESIEPLSDKVNRLLLSRIHKHIDEFDSVIIEDYGKGVINPTLVGELIELARKKNKIITVDPKEDHFDFYEGVTALTPNLKEAQTAVQFRVRNKKEIQMLGKMILQRYRPQALLLTLGEDGMMLFCENEYHHIPTAALEVYDVTGAGDTVIATFTLALTAGLEFDEAAHLANYAAGIVVSKLGAVCPTPRELKEVIDARK